jgi:sister-chromatid-cohesion protein PDS5
MVSNFLFLFTLHLQLLVKKYTMERLAEVYRVSCEKSRDTASLNEYDWIPGKIVRCFYDKDFR